MIEDLHSAIVRVRIASLQSDWATCDEHIALLFLGDNALLDNAMLTRSLPEFSANRPLEKSYAVGAIVR
ncbi:hypothetical protein ColTof4_04121 [Colletotrichum tofieldiae]|nr:hypothetical protein ColTof3_13970 [Colletotrichum tofieldiae]GKT71698.1 hypothetical protein ColTof4_04121 [Colletotrichum tofieldiae]GKT95136.1 hypothetical protein Ct61P_12986 [Colletotrichum tofieldiae]